MAGQLESVDARNQWLRDTNRRLTAENRWWRGIALAAILTVPLTAYVVHENTRVLGLTSDGRVLLLPAVSQATLTDSQLVSWVTRTACDVMSFSHVNRDEHFRRVSQFFTAASYQTFHKSLTDSGVWAAVKSLYQDYQCATRGPAVITDARRVEDRWTWRVQIPVYISLFSGGKKDSRASVLEIMVVAMSPAERLDMAAIDWWLERPSGG